MNLALKRRFDTSKIDYLGDRRAVLNGEPRSLTNTKTELGVSRSRGISVRSAVQGGGERRELVTTRRYWQISHTCRHPYGPQRRTAQYGALQPASPPDPEIWQTWRQP
jgi:hypothetical protein